MEVLSFGEQVKIILSRKGMTIKELAELIEDTTGKKMSRQNLTQRLGRDNFQEKDMRMIAKILGCPFQLSIFPVENEAGEKTEPMEELLLKYVKHPKVQPKKKPRTMVFTSRCLYLTRIRRKQRRKSRTGKRKRLCLRMRTGCRLREK